MNFRDLTAAAFLGLDEEEEQEYRPPEEDGRLGTLLQLVKAHPDGVTLPQLEEGLHRFGYKVARKTIEGDLDDLIKAREAYMHQPRKNAMRTYYPNGRLIHPLLKVASEIRGKRYVATVQHSRSGPAIQLQERAYSLLNGETVEGAIFVDMAGLDDLKALIDEIHMRFQSHGEVAGT